MFPCEVLFGGPDRPPGRLRNALAERIEAVPAGGSIDWVTYYFRDRRLAADLVRARQRGVDVRVSIDGRPRTPAANDAVRRLLQPDLGDGLRVVMPSPGLAIGRLLPQRLHEKLYCFSHPEPVALVGSFNPSGDEPEAEPEILRAIGDQDRGHNLLVALRSPLLVNGLVDHARRLHGGHTRFLDRFRPSSNHGVTQDGTTIHFWPRMGRDPVNELLRRCGAGYRVRIAASHLSGPTSARTLRSLARRGADVTVLAEATQRRVPHRSEVQLRAGGVHFVRAIHPEGLPMHAKFTLVDGRGERWAIFGSFNWSERSRRLNREIGAISSDPKLFDAFAERWEILQRSFGDGGRN
jgi:phosphatidylserine/phosphatidylglycerophosphate/cardiolipin synthase-like enzyme